MQCAELELVLEQGGGEPLPAQAQEHLNSCGICRQLVAELDRIEAAAREFPAEVEPPDRVWISLRAQLESEGIIRTAAPLPSREAWFDPIRALFARPALAGAFLTIVLAGAVMFSLKPVGPPSPENSVSNGPQPVLAQARIQLNNVEHGILPAAAAPSGVDASLRHNLEIVDNFIAQCEKTVQDDPQDDVARDYLSGAYQQKAELLATIQVRNTTGD